MPVVISKLQELLQECISVWQSVSTARSSEPEIERYAVRSNSIAALGYDGAKRCLQVEYLNGALYRTDDVPEYIYSRLVSSDDFDRHFCAEIIEKRSLARIGAVFPIYG